MTLLKGCRSPFSKGFGFWDEVFIILIHDDKPPPLHVTSVLFLKGLNHLFSPEMSLSMKKYNQLLNNGWIPMSIEDLRATSGIEGHLYTHENNIRQIAQCSLTAIVSIAFFIKLLFKSTKSQEI